MSSQPTPATPRKAREVFHGLETASLKPLSASQLEQTVTRVTSDSRELERGCVFVAVRGVSQDGHQFIPQAILAGAAFIVGEERLSAGPSAPPFIEVKDSREALALLAANFFGNPSRSMRLVGVTGTSGKTTTTYVMEAILKEAGYDVGVIGTVNFRHGAEVLPSTHTTPGPVELHSLLSQMKARGASAVVMEVSSHALKQKRADYLAFDAMIFTNLSAEHLDFHPDMEDYFQAKARLFTDYVRHARTGGKKPVAAVNADDSYGERLLRLIESDARRELEAYSFGLATGSRIPGAGLKCSISGIQGKVLEIEVNSALIGRFNAYNILGALAAAKGMGVSPEAISRGISSLKLVPGRLEPVSNPKGIHVLVDYAHKPDALEKVLETLKELCSRQRLITVFGCGGDRDRSKRPKMGQIAVRFSDQVIVTSDNPRTEDPDSIIREIVAGIEQISAQKERYRVEADRRKAIFAAIKQARPGDIVVIAGKGHEDYQILADPKSPGKTYKIHFDDREVAGEALK